MTAQVTLTLSDFLLARIAEDEAAARTATPGPWEVGQAGSVWSPRRSGAGEDRADRVMWTDRDQALDAEHITRWHPARVLAECEAKRRIVEHHTFSRGDDEFPLCAICTELGPDAQGWPCLTLCLLALPYASHPDYRDDWRP